MHCNSPLFKELCWNILWKFLSSSVIAKLLGDSSIISNLVCLTMCKFSFYSIVIYHSGFSFCIFQEKLSLLEMLPAQAAPCIGRWSCVGAGEDTVCCRRPHICRRLLEAWVVQGRASTWGGLLFKVCLSGEAQCWVRQPQAAPKDLLPIWNTFNEVL